MANDKIAVVIPAYNEEKSLKKILPKLTKKFIVILVNDGSTDKTKLIAKTFHCIVVNHNENQGYEHALYSGFQKAIKMNFDYCLSFDADGQHLSDDIIRLLRKFKETDSDMVIGERKKYQRFSEALLGFFSYLFFKLKDPLSGMKGYKISFLKKADKSNCIFEKNSIGLLPLIFALRSKAKISTISIDCNSREGKPRFHSSVRSNFIILRFIIIFFKKIYF